MCVKLTFENVDGPVLHPAPHLEVVVGEQLGGGGAGRPAQQHHARPGAPAGVVGAGAEQGVARPPGPIGEGLAIGAGVLVSA